MRPSIQLFKIFRLEILANIFSAILQQTLPYFSDSYESLSTSRRTNSALSETSKLPYYNIEFKIIVFCSDFLINLTQLGIIISYICESLKTLLKSLVHFIPLNNFIK